MPNKKINALDVKVAVSTDLMLVGDPTTGTAYKSTVATLPLVPYTGATGAVSLGLYGLTSGTLTLQPQALNTSTYKITQQMASNDYWSIYGFATVADEGDLFFELQDNAAFANGQRFRFHYGADSSGTPKDILLMDYNSATIDGTVKVNTLAGTSIRMVVSDSQGQLSTQAIPTLSSGGSSVAYYLNGGTAASVGTYYQMSKTAVLGTAADFNLVGNGLISQFLTDVGDPNRLEIPGGNWNFEMYFNISSSGGNTAFYVELLKYNGSTFTSIASTVSTPEEITGGTSIDLYLTSLAIPQTTLLVTDRLALRVYIVNNSGGRTVTLHTQDSHLCEIITNFAGGVAALNGLTANTQYFATGTSGTDFGISSISDTHTFNLPTASATNRGALSSADWSTFNNKVPSERTLTINGTAFDLSADRSWTIPSSNIYNSDGTLTAARTLTHGGFNLSLVGSTYTNRFTSAGRLLLGIITESTYLLDVNGTARFNDNLRVNQYWTSFFGNTSSSSNNPTGVNGISIGWNRSGGAGESIFAYGINNGGTTPRLDFSSWDGTTLTTRFSLSNTGVANFSNILTGIITSSTTYSSALNGVNIQTSNNGANGITFQGVSTATWYVGRTTGSTDNLTFYNNITGNVLNIITATGNVLVGTSTDIPSSILTLNSTTKGFIPPRLSTTQKTSIASPVAGLQVYDTTLNAVSVYDGATWRNDTDTVTTNRQTASYTLALTDRGKLVEMNVASANTLTVPLNSSIAFPIGSKIDVTQYGAGATTITATSGVTIRSFTSYLKIAGQYAACTLVKIGTDEWYCYGNLIA